MPEPLPVIDEMDDQTFDLLRDKTPTQRLAMAFAMNRTARYLMAGGIRWQYPEWTDEQVQAEVVRRMTRGAE